MFLNLHRNLLHFLINPSGRQTGNKKLLGQSNNKRNHLILAASHFKEIHIFRPHVRLKCSNRHFLQCRSVHQGCRLGRGSDGNKNTSGEVAQRCRSQRQIEASSHTAIKMLLSRLKLVCRMADVHLGRVSVVHFALWGSSTSRSHT